MWLYVGSKASTPTTFLAAAGLKGLSRGQDAGSEIGIALAYET